MNTLSSIRQTDKKGFRRCAILKIDLSGRIVNVDAFTEKLLGSPGEELFGRSIEEFLDKESYNSVLYVLNNGTRYESFYETAELVFIDSRGEQHALNATISLNFIGGNPANYQIVINPHHQRMPVYSQPSDSRDITGLLFDFISNLNGQVDWKELSRIFLDIEEIIHLGIYRYSKGILDLVKTVSRSPELIIETDSSIIINRILKVVDNRQPCLNCKIEGSGYFAGDGSAELAESSYPLIHGSNCWGAIRLVHIGDITQTGVNLEAIAGFLGNALISFLGDKPKSKDKKRNPAIP